MSETDVRARVTLARETIHNPDEPRHFMRIKPVTGRVRILRDGRVLAESARALRVLEAGRDLYDPVLYLPAADVRAKLSLIEKRTYCPLKGHASYFDLVSDEGRVDVPEIAWSYRETLDCAVALKDLVAFDASRVVIEESPAPGGPAS
jgi:uncharacterized protein (DUF427 family)